MAKQTTDSKKPGRKPAAKKTTGVRPVDTAELAADGRNPRTMSDEAAAGLSESIKEFGDLAGITFNVRTGELVTGHQRVAQIREQYGEQQIEITDEAAGLGVIRVDDGHVFPVRVVDWSPARQRAANVAANNHRIQGEFSEDLTSYLLEVQAELDEELPGLMDAVCLTELLAEGMSTADATEDGDVEGKQTTTEVAINESFQVIVQCTDEAHQKELYERFTGEGLACKVLTL